MVCQVLSTSVIFTGFIMFHLFISDTRFQAPDPKLSFITRKNKLTIFPKFKHGPVKLENEVSFVEKSSVVTIYKDTGIESPIFYHEVHRPPEDYLESNTISSYREKYTFYHLRNAFVSPKELIGLEEGGYWESITRFRLNNYQWMPTVAGYTDVIYPIFHWHKVYGHFLNDAVGGFLSTPEWVWAQNPVIVVDVPKEWVTEFLNILGHPDIEVVQVNYGYVFGENVYVTRAFEDYHGFGIRAFPLLREKIAKYYQLDKIKATEYFVCNKKEGKARHYTNMEELRSILISDTKLDWKVLKDDFSDKVTTVRTFASAKLIVLPCGSISFNVLYMKKYTGTVQLMADRVEFPSTRMSLMLGVWTVAILHPHMKHFGGPGAANIPVVVESTKYVLYAIDNGKWPQYGNNYHVAFDIQLFKKFYEKNGDIFLDFNVVYPYDQDKISKYI